MISQRKRRLSWKGLFHKLCLFCLIHLFNTPRSAILSLCTILTMLKSNFHDNYVHVSSIYNLQKEEKKQKDHPTISIIPMEVHSSVLLLFGVGSVMLLV